MTWGVSAPAMLVVMALAVPVASQVTPDQGQLAARIQSGTQDERAAAVTSVLTISPAERRLSLELALTGELTRLRGEIDRRREARLAGKTLAPVADEGDYLFSVIDAVSRSLDPNSVRALVPWLGTGNRAITAVVALGERSVLDVAAAAVDPANGDASVALLVLGHMWRDQGKYPLSAASKRVIVDAAELRLSGTQREAVLQEAADLAVATGDDTLIGRVEALARNPDAVRDFGIRDPEAIAYIHRKATESLSRRERR
jgi:hypothetical protein